HYEIAGYWVAFYFEFGRLKWLPHDFSRSFLCTPNILRLGTTSRHGKRQYSLKFSLRQNVTPNMRMKTLSHFEINPKAQNPVASTSHYGCGVQVMAARCHVGDAS